MQEIKKENGETLIRLGYYVKDHDAPESNYVWGSQRAFVLPKGDFITFFGRSERREYFDRIRPCSHS